MQRFKISINGLVVLTAKRRKITVGTFFYTKGNMTIDSQGFRLVVYFVFIIFGIHNNPAIFKDYFSRIYV